jgi:hypothetical protein
VKKDRGVIVYNLCQKILCLSRKLLRFRPVKPYVNRQDLSKYYYIHFKSTIYSAVQV